MPPVWNPTTGVPQASASITVLGKLSCNDGTTNTSAALYASRIASGSLQPPEMQVARAGHGCGVAPTERHDAQVRHAAKAVDCIGQLGPALATIAQVVGDEEERAITGRESQPRAHGPSINWAIQRRVDAVGNYRDFKPARGLRRASAPIQRLGVTMCREPAGSPASTRALRSSTRCGDVRQIGRRQDWARAARRGEPPAFVIVMASARKWVHVMQCPHERPAAAHRREHAEVEQVGGPVQVADVRGGHLPHRRRPKAVQSRVNAE